MTAEVGMACTIVSCIVTFLLRIASVARATNVRGAGESRPTGLDMFTTTDLGQSVARSGSRWPCGPRENLFYIRWLGATSYEYLCCPRARGYRHAEGIRQCAASDTTHTGTIPYPKQAVKSKLRSVGSALCRSGPRSGPGCATHAGRCRGARSTPAPGSSARAARGRTTAGTQ